MNKLIVLMYHDIVESPELFDTSGFQGVIINRYKLVKKDFLLHLEFIKEMELPVDQLELTFDDGGISNYSIIAPILESFGLKGIFFIPTSCIGQSHFLTSEMIKDLHNRGHIIGSHTHTHPLWLNKLDANTIKKEWVNSIDTLSGIIGEKVTCASIPGGKHSKIVEEQSRKSGIRKLYTSYPTNSLVWRKGMQIIGRHAVLNESSLSDLQKVLNRNTLYSLKKKTRYILLKTLKFCFGNNYAQLRKKLV